MFLDFDLERFIRTYVTKRERSLLADDFERFDAELHNRIDGKRVLVIGGAGSIGSHYIKAILRFPIRSLTVVDTNENGLTELVRDLRSSSVPYQIPEDFVTYPMNFADPVFEKMFCARGPFDIVANFAAHKHVRSEKDLFSIEAMITNNVLRARGLLDLLVRHPPEAFFCVSTDKAANPVNVMGASKKLMEEMIMAYADRIPVKTARFANVAFSNGSLPLGFLDRLTRHQPLACPLGIRRFFVSPIESGELCLLASILGESGDILYPELDENRDMIPFDAIVRDLLSVLKLGVCSCKTDEEAKRQAAAFFADPAAREKGYPVLFFQSDTSGEKTFEEFFTPTEVLDTERFVHLGVIKNAKRRPLPEIDSIFENLRALFARTGTTKADVVHVLRDYLPNFHHIEKGKGLDSRM